MSSCKKLRMFHCMKILLTLFGTIVANQTILDNMSPEEIKLFFGSRDGTAPEYQLITFDWFSKMKRSTQVDFTINCNFSGALFNTTLQLVDDPIIGRSSAIWFATSDANAFNSVHYYPDPTVFERIGDIDFYQDVQKGSAITKFEHPEFGPIFTGIICQNYAIKALPQRFTHGIVTPMSGHAVRMRSAGVDDEDKTDELGAASSIHVIFKIYEVLQEHFLRQFRRTKNISYARKIHQNKAARKLQEPPEVVYPKLFITVDYGSIINFSDDVIMYVIAFWNAVDSMYRQLDNPMVRLNIAGIVIPRDGTATPYIAPNTSNVATLNIDDVLSGMALHFYAENQRFPFYRYNIVMAMTRKLLCDYQHRDNLCHPVAGYATSSSACSKKWYDGNKDAIEGVGIASFDSIFGGVLLTAHELAHVLGVDHDGEELSQSCSNTGGYTMVPDSSYATTLKWSTCSKEAFKIYFSSSDGLCLRDPPVEIDPALQNMAGAWLSMDGQCKNHIKNSTGACTKSNISDICNSHGCMVNGSCQDVSDKPLDGSSCGKRKYCEKSECKGDAA